jgi:hypothetical protein
MCRKLLFVGAVILLLVGAAATPVSIRVEGNPPPTPEPVKPPWITGKNPDVSLSAGEEEELSPSGIVKYWEGVDVPLLDPPPSYVDLAPQHAADNPPAVPALAIPQRYQYPADVTCGAAALGMALEFLSLNGEGNAPSSEALVDELKNSGLLYETGTGVEELAYLARGQGYQGTTAFHNWTLEQLAEQLHLGKPVVVSLGANGVGKPGHFVTLSGVSADGKWVSYNDPILGAQTVPADDFLYQWNLQGNSGLLVQKTPLKAANDPMLPWMGLFGALSTLAVLVKSNPTRTDLKETLRSIRGMLSDPRRKGLGGALIPGGGSSSSPPYRAPAGFKWKKTFTPKYGWKDVEIVEKVEVPNMVRTWAVVKVNRWMEKVPVYKTVKVDRGRWAYRTVTKYRTERYRTRERYRVKKSYWYRVNGRLRRGTRYEWKTRTVVKTRRVRYTERQRYWVPKIVTEQRFVRNRQIEHRDPVYGWREEKRGTKIVERTKTTRAWKPVGTAVKWKLERNSKLTPTRTPTPYPSSTPSPFPNHTPATTPSPYPASMSGPNFWQELGIGLSGSMVKVANTINQKIKDPVKKTILNPSWWQDKVIQASKTSQSVLSLSASNEWDFNLFSQEGVIAQSYVPPNILQMLYVEQKFDIKPKVKITGNPGSFMDFDVTSGTWKVNLGEKLSLFTSLKGGGMTLGVGIKKPGDDTPHDYLVDKQ